MKDRLTRLMNMTRRGMTGSFVFGRVECVDVDIAHGITLGGKH
jgi:hypothetical protein